MGKYGPKEYGYTPSTCRQACPQYKYFALQNGGWCTCDDDFSTPSDIYTQVDDTECNKGGVGQGGAWRNAVYSNTDIYLGCYIDDGTRDFKFGPKQYGYTPATCRQACPQYKYFALQNGGWCT